MPPMKVTLRLVFSSGFLFNYDVKTPTGHYFCFSINIELTVLKSRHRVDLYYIFVSSLFAGFK